MCFTTDILRQYPWDAYSITEDTEYGLTLLEHHISAAYLPEASVITHLPTTIRAASNTARAVGKGQCRPSETSPTQDDQGSSALT